MSEIDLETYNLLFDMACKYESQLNGYPLVTEKVYAEQKENEIVGTSDAIVQMYELMKAFQQDIEEYYLDTNYKKLGHDNYVNDNPFEGRGVVYTVITGEYEELKKPLFVDDKLDYICFTNNKSMASDFWEIRFLENEDELDNVRLARRTKILCSEYLDDYDYSIYIDGSFEIIGDIHKLIDFNSKGRGMLVFAHNMCDGIGEELDLCISLGKDIPELMKAQVWKYLEDGYDMRLGMIASGCIIRKHHDEKLDETMKYWWSQVRNESKRDQLSFCYSCWKNEYEFDVCNRLAIDNEYIKLHEHK